MATEADVLADREVLYADREAGILKFLNRTNVILDHAGSMSPQYVSAERYASDVSYLLYALERSRGGQS